MKVAFLDRDGVLNIDYGYVHTWNQFVWIPGSIDAMKKLKENDYSIIIVTNQAGIAKGYYSEDDFHRLMNQVRGHLKNFNIEILDIFYCPHHVDGKIQEYCKDCQCRKPKPGMILDAKEKYNVNMGASLLVGDRESDIIAGKAAGVGQTVKVDSIKSDSDISDHENLNKTKLLSAVEKILKYGG